MAVNFVVRNKVDIYKHPGYESEKKEMNGWCINVGDIHGNAIKLLFILVYHGFMTDISANDYKCLVEIYKKSPENLTNEDLQKFKLILDNAKFNNKLQLRLLGDTLADRGSNDFFTLLILGKLNQFNVPTEILLSNHDIEFINGYEDAYEKDGTFNSLLMEHPITDEQRKTEQYRDPKRQFRSMANLQRLIDRKVVTKNEVLELAAEAYIPKLKIISYEQIGENELNLYSHAGIDLETIKAILDKINVDYLDANIKESTQSFDEINSHVQEVGENKKLHELWPQEGLYLIENARLSKTVNFDLKQYPYVHVAWNRDYEGLNRSRVPSNNNGIQFNFFHGHDNTDPEAKNDQKNGNIYNLNNQLGMTDNLNSGTYSYAETMDYSHELYLKTTKLHFEAVTLYVELFGKYQDIEKLNKRSEEISDNLIPYEQFYKKNSDLEVLYSKFENFRKKIQEIFESIRKVETELISKKDSGYLSNSKKLEEDLDKIRYCKGVVSDKLGKANEFAQKLPEYLSNQKAFHDKLHAFYKKNSNDFSIFIAQGEPNYYGIKDIKIVELSTKKEYLLTFDGQNYSFNYGNKVQPNGRGPVLIDAPPEIIDEFLKDINSLFDPLSKPILDYYRPPIDCTVFTDTNRHINAESKCRLHINGKKLSELRKNSFLNDINEIKSFKELLRKNFGVENPSDDNVSKLMNLIPLNQTENLEKKKCDLKKFLRNNFSVENPSDDKVSELMKSILLKDIQSFKEILITNLKPNFGFKNLNSAQQNLFWDNLIEHLDQGGLPHVTEHYLKEKIPRFPTSFMDSGKEEHIDLFINDEGHLCIRTKNSFKEFIDDKGKKSFAKKGEYFFKTETECIIKPFVIGDCADIYLSVTFPKAELSIDPDINNKFPQLVPNIKNKRYNIVDLECGECLVGKKPVLKKTPSASANEQQSAAEPPQVVEKEPLVKSNQATPTTPNRSVEDQVKGRKNLGITRGTVATLREKFDPQPSQANTNSSPIPQPTLANKSQDTQKSAVEETSSASSPTESSTTITTANIERETVKRSGTIQTGQRNPPKSTLVIKPPQAIFSGVSSGGLHSRSTFFVGLGNVNEGAAIGANSDPGLSISDSRVQSKRNEVTHENKRRSVQNDDDFQTKISSIKNLVKARFSFPYSVENSEGLEMLLKLREHKIGTITISIESIDYGKLSLRNQSSQPDHLMAIGYVNAILKKINEVSPPYNSPGKR